MENKSQLKRIVLYTLLYRLMDVEEILWNVADFIIKPFALMRRWTAYQISKMPK